MGSDYSLNIKFPQGQTLLSTGWWAGEVEAKIRRKERRLFFDSGTATLDANNERYPNRRDAQLQQVGFQFGKDWITQKFDSVE
jgi:hypothetical protein